MALAHLRHIDAADELLARVQFLQNVSPLFLLPLVVPLSVVVLRLLQLEPPEMGLALLLLLEHVLVRQDQGIPDCPAWLRAPIGALHGASLPRNAAL